MIPGMRVILLPDTMDSVMVSLQRLVMLNADPACASAPEAQVPANRATTMSSAATKLDFPEIAMVLDLA